MFRILDIDQLKEKPIDLHYVYKPTKEGNDMTNKKSDEAKVKHMERLEQFVPIVERVHGGNHPEIFKVGQLFNELNESIQAKNEGAVLDQEFEELREITNNYQVPDDVCESYEAVYHMLEELDLAYSKE